MHYLAVPSPPISIVRGLLIMVVNLWCAGFLPADSASAAGQQGSGTHSSQVTARATFAGGCFWCMEEAFEAVPGVLAVTSGYIGGRTKDPTYEQVSNGDTGHTEAIEILYDPAKVQFARLLQVFWRNVDAVDGDGQFCDRGSQYRSGIFVHSEEQHRQAEASKQEAAKALGRDIKTEIVKAGQFYEAEGYHQDYYKKNPVRYKFYKWNCGREKRLAELWGKSRVP